ncbi:hypothetical protein CRUP_000586 [Coryphaenoides rupestris]|nr:hypothetical protein CRUP_000586 [Coryphaenoides rupestris]
MVTGGGMGRHGYHSGVGGEASLGGVERCGDSVSMCTFIFISFSRICTSCCMEGRCPDSSLDHTGTRRRAVEGEEPQEEERTPQPPARHSAPDQ